MKILHETQNHYMVGTPKGGYEVYKNGPTAATRVAQIGYPGAQGFARAKQEMDRRESTLNPSSGYEMPSGAKIPSEHS